MHAQIWVRMKDMGENGKGNGSEKLPTEPTHRIPPPSHPPPQCPRCFSTSTRFLSYNNRSASQPRYYCRSCRRGWTLGGTLRNIPIGGNRRKSNKPKGNLASAGLYSCSFSLRGEFSIVRENLSPQQPLPPRPEMRGFSYIGCMPIANSLMTFLEELLSSFANMQNLNSSPGFNQLPPSGGGHISGVTGIHGVALTNFSEQGVSGTPVRQQQIQRPNYQSNDGQQAMVLPSRILGSLPQVPINRPSASTTNATRARRNNIPGRGSAMNNINQWPGEFDMDDVDDLAPGPSSPPPPA